MVTWAYLRNTKTGEHVSTPNPDVYEAYPYWERTTQGAYEKWRDENSVDAGADDDDTITETEFDLGVGRMIPGLWRLTQDDGGITSMELVSENPDELTTLRQQLADMRAVLAGVLKWFTVTPIERQDIRTLQPYTEIKMRVQVEPRSTTGGYGVLGEDDLANAVYKALQAGESGEAE